MKISPFASAAVAAALITTTAIAGPVPVPSQFAMNSGGFRAGSGDGANNSELAIVFTVLAMPNIFSWPVDDGVDPANVATPAAVPAPPADLANLYFGNQNQPNDMLASVTPVVAGLPVTPAAIAVPEPAPVALLVLGLTALGVARRRAVCS